jgi:hypothetical protein
MKIYIAAPYEKKTLVRQAVSDLASHGIGVTCTWQDSLKDAETDVEKKDAAWNCLHEIDRADGYILFRDDEKVRGGCEFELGYIFANVLNTSYLHRKPVWIIGDKFSVFHALPHFHVYNTLPDAMASIIMSCV